MPSIFGTWKNELSYSGMSVTTAMTFEENGSYHTHMVYDMNGGCQQHIHHYGRVEVGMNAIKLYFESGKTKKTNCRDTSKNFEMRDFTDVETNEAKNLLENEIRFSVDGERLTTIVKGPTGNMKIVYNRHTK